MRRILFALLIFSYPAFSQYAYRVVPASSLPGICDPRNGDVIFLTAGNTGLYACTALNTWARVDTSAIFNVKSFGAIGDGTHDDTAAIAATFTAAGNSKHVIFPSGVYKTTAPITIAGNNLFIGGEAGASIAMSGAGGNIVVVTGTNNTLQGLGIGTLGGASLNNGYGLYLNGAINTTLINVTVNHVQKDALRINGSFSSQIIGGLYGAGFSDPGSSGAYVTTVSNANLLFLRVTFDAGAANIGVTDLGSVGGTYQTCSFEGNTGTAIGMNMGAALNVSIDSSFFEGNHTCVRLGTGGVTPQGVNIRNNYFYTLEANAVGIDIIRAFGVDINLNDFVPNVGAGTVGVQIANDPANVRKITLGQGNLNNGLATLVSDAGRIAINLFTWNAFFPPFMDFAALNGLAPADGAIVFCSNCTIANCPAAGTGALAVRTNGAWVCK